MGVGEGGAGGAAARDGAEAPPAEAQFVSRSKYLPESYEELLEDAARSTQAALRDGLRTLEVEFPPLGSNSSEYSAKGDDFIESNLVLALSFAGKLSESTGQTVRVVVPDFVELDRLEDEKRTTLEMLEGRVALGSLSEAGGLQASFQEAVFGKRGLTSFWAGEGFKLGERNSSGGETDNAGDIAEDIVLCINASAIELPDVRQYYDRFGRDRPFILFNLQLETLRADLGIIGFPPRSLHHEFFTRFRSVFFLRNRQYSKSVNVPPFLINYSGALFREYPGPWQVMLRQDDGSLVCIAEDDVRFTLAEAKYELMEAMGLRTEEKGSTMEFLRRGYKQGTWWEEAAGSEVETSSEWRS